MSLDRCSHGTYRSSPFELLGYSVESAWLLPDVKLGHEEEVTEHCHCHHNPHDQEDYEPDVVFAHWCAAPSVRLPRRHPP